MKDHIEDNRGHWVHISAGFDDYPLTQKARCVYLHIVRRADKDGSAFPSYQSIGDHCFLLDYASAETRRRKAMQAVKELNQKRLISTRKRTNIVGGNISNVYVLNPSHMWAPAAKILEEYQDRMPQIVERVAGDIYTPPSDYISPANDHISPASDDGSLGGDHINPPSDQIVTLRNNTQGIPLKGIPLKEESPLTPQGESQTQVAQAEISEPEPEQQEASEAVPVQVELWEDAKPVKTNAGSEIKKSSAAPRRQKMRIDNGQVEEFGLIYNENRPDRWMECFKLTEKRTTAIKDMIKECQGMQHTWQEVLLISLAQCKIDPFMSTKYHNGSIDALFMTWKGQTAPNWLRMYEAALGTGLNSDAVHDSGMTAAEIQKAKEQAEWKAICEKMEVEYV